MADKVLGSGKTYFEVEDASGNLGTGERYLSETPDFALTVTPTLLDDWTSDGKTAEKDFAVTTRVERGGRMTCKDMILDNLAYFWPGALSTVTQVATAVVDEAVKGWKDKWTQLGQSTANPTGIRNIASVVITATGGTPTYVAGTDYELDAVMGRFRVIPAGAIADGASLLVDYTPVANSRTRLASDQLGPKYGALRFIADNTAGANKDIYIPKVQLVPEGDLALKSRETLQMLTFTLNIGTRTGFAQVYADGRPV